ncbi:ParB N-terminal domain-containing protein [Cupriavidus sp. CV2]|uniref:ParB N-terminal domain-containing protein n=1 Tax=Cupriavidus ulmosensis TaxID=3065913 RepID=UPI00296B069B|nr:ParB N-terminal domain-containing protein [Cupriavidus sp. CV2]MDW3688870.1 ParB N-terminal domain-containing protein [Cupriavidus sp. CV2]
MQPIVVRPVEDGYDEIIAGERRYRAAKEVFGMEYEMPIMVKDVDDETAEALAIIEKVARDDMAPSEEGATCQFGCDLFGVTAGSPSSALTEIPAAGVNRQRDARRDRVGPVSGMGNFAHQELPAAHCVVRWPQGPHMRRAEFRWFRVAGSLQRFLVFADYFFKQAILGVCADGEKDHIG